MSNTKRKDHYIEASGSHLFGDEWKATADRKKWYKPSKKNKDGQLKKIRPVTRPKIKNAMLRPDEDGEVILPVDKKTDVWYYN